MMTMLRLYVELIHSNVRRPSQKVHLKTDFHGIEWFVCLEFGALAFAEPRVVLHREISVTGVVFQ